MAKGAPGAATVEGAAPAAGATAGAKSGRADVLFDVPVVAEVPSANWERPPGPVVVVVEPGTADPVLAPPFW